MPLASPHSVVIVRWPAGWLPDRLTAEPDQQAVERVELSYVKRQTAYRTARDFNRAQQGNGRTLWAIVRRQAVEGGAR